ncbi:MAG: FliH/SctL family protein [Thermoguttaceae bacterium]|jgi:flagellar assembly protein FliH
MGYTDENADGLRPFPMRHLSRSGSDNPSETLREEAARITETARGQIDRYRQDAELALQKKEEELNTLRNELERRAAELERREQNLEKRNSNDGWDQGYQEGLAAGREDGLAEGRKSAQENWEHDFARVREEKLRQWSDSKEPLFGKLVDELSSAREQLLSYWEKNILQIAAVIAHQAIARELPQIKDVTLGLLREALELAIGCTSIKIQMNPDDLKELRPSVEALLKEFSQITLVEILEDPRITQGGCIVESPVGMIDQRLEKRVQRIIDELSH